MIVKDIKEYFKGWYVGNFEPTIFKTDACELGYKLHKQWSEWERHSHQAVEVNFLIRGKMKVNDTVIYEGEVFLIESGEVTKPTFLTDCEVIVLKVPCIPNDKFIVEDFEDEYYPKAF